MLLRQIISTWKRIKNERVKRSERGQPRSAGQLQEVQHLSNGKPGEKQKEQKKYSK